MNSRNDMVTVFVVRPGEDGTSHEFLQLRRSADEFMGGTWQIIRGGIEPGETAVTGALRELKEESGLSPAEFYRLGSVESFYIPFEETLWHAIPFCAIVPRDAAVALNEEHDGYRWLSHDGYVAHVLWQSELQLLPGLIRDILFDGAAKPFLKIELPEAGPGSGR